MFKRTNFGQSVYSQDKWNLVNSTTNQADWTNPTFNQQQYAEYPHPLTTNQQHKSIHATAKMGLKEMVNKVIDRIRRKKKAQKMIFEYKVQDGVYFDAITNEQIEDPWILARIKSHEADQLAKAKRGIRRSVKKFLSSKKGKVTKRETSHYSYSEQDNAQRAAIAGLGTSNTARPKRAVTSYERAVQSSSGQQALGTRALTHGQGTGSFEYQESTGSFEYQDEDQASEHDESEWADFWTWWVWPWWTRWEL